MIINNFYLILDKIILINHNSYFDKSAYLNLPYLNSNPSSNNLCGCTLWLWNKIQDNYPKHIYKTVCGIVKYVPLFFNYPIVLYKLSYVWC